MKKTLYILLLALLLAGAYLMGSINSSKVITAPAASWTGNSAAAQAWRELIVSMEAAGAKVFASTDDPLQRLDGLQYLSQLLSASLEMKLAKGSQAEPVFTNWMGSFRKFLGDSPDAVYHTAEISAQYSYEITGNIADAQYLGFMLYGKGLTGWNRAAANISNETLTLDKNGNFTIVLSKKKPDRDYIDWLPLEDDIHMLMVRQYFHGRIGKQEASFGIRNLTSVEYNTPSDAAVAVAMQNATTFFNETLDGTIALIKMISANPNNPEPPKSYSQDFSGIFYPTFDNQYLGSWYKIEHDEALIIEGDVPDAPYWSVSLQNRWLQSLDYQQYQVTLNNHQIKTTNGRYRIIVSHQNPGTGNWIDTAGNREGLLSIRYQLSKDATVPEQRLVKFSEL